MFLSTAHDLAGSDQGGFNDPYVRLSLVPAVDNRKRQTTIHRNDPNPFFDQHFKFPVSHEDLQEKTLVLQVRRNGLLEPISLSNLFSTITSVRFINFNRYKFKSS